ncbi:phosphonate ABC transporter substrate-binding protein [Bordetella sp. 15P40C-2]|uniref:phosphonate ABC transporter substrate-binding protein n=1 Tax=Bordetella sp. 15P40C-2 TaxID=2572246 RepID=UPI00132B2C07|nr:phosphonate ABC transporter substrate-binding protein [Bordetella sp. 15P40C-2]MVW70820.1 phosphonate ABC transporter substrate-binding protein [Bordetella sp. 15P40C-2]
MLRRTFLALTAAATFSSAAWSADIKPLNFGFISTESSTNLKSAWQPLLDDLSQALGVSVVPFFASDYAGIIEGMRFNKVQLAWFGNKSAMEAVDRAQGDVIASVIDGDGNPGYWSLLLVHQDSDLHTLEDVLKKGGQLSYGAGDPNSTSGSLVPGYFLWAANGIDPKKFFKSVRAANHEANLLSVVNKQVDVAVNNSEMLERYHRSTGKDARDSVRVLWKSPLIPADPIVIRRDVPTELKNRIQTFLVNYGKGANAQHEQQVLAKLTYQGFRESSNTQLIPIRQMELAKLKLGIENDTTLSASDKQARLAELDQRLAALNQTAAP